LIEFLEETKKLEHFVSYADGIGHRYVKVLDKKIETKYKFTSLVSDAHKLNLKAHPYSFRVDTLNEFSTFEEIMETLLFNVNIDGAFTDFPDKGLWFLQKEKSK